MFVFVYSSDIIHLSDSFGLKQTVQFVIPTTFFIQNTWYVVYRDELAILLLVKRENEFILTLVSFRFCLVISKSNTNVPVFP